MIKKHQLAVYLIVSLFLSACNTDSHSHPHDGEQPTKDLLAENQSLKKENEALRRKIQLDSVTIQRMNEDKIVAPPPAPTNTPADGPIRVGEHNLTLQWIESENPGKVEVTPLADNKYSITGQQKGDNTDDYVSIDGQLTVLDDKILLFEGKLTTQVSYVNGGQPCLRTEPLHFRATGNRKYWRLKEKDNCEGNNVVDYVDIYF